MDKKAVLKLNLQEFLSELKTSEAGLTAHEAEKRLAEYGPNTLGKKTANGWKVFAKQFRSALIYLLIAATLISYSIRDFTDGTVILVILLINAFLGFYQEYKSEKIIEKLSQFVSRQVRVKRDGQDTLLDESQIVPGDIITIREGDIVPADLRLLETNDLQVNESQLTGESMPQSKFIPKDSSEESPKKSSKALSKESPKKSLGKTPATASELLFTGSIIEKGQGTGVVYATARNTELGTIAKLSTETKKQTEYEKSLKSFSSFLVKVTLIGLSFVFIAKLLLHGSFSDTSALLLFIIALAVAVVPEALPVIATVSLSRGALGLAKKRVVVRRLSSVEDFGNVNLLCTDKTGTITENKMVINKIVSGDNELFQKLAYAAITPLKNRKHRTQNSYDDAFINYVTEPIQREAKNLSIVAEVPFDPEDRRRRVVLSDAKSGRDYLVVIGAPEVLLEIAHVASADKKPEHLQKSEYLQAIKKEGASGLHHLALAYKEIKYAKGFDLLKNESDLIFLGYVSLLDPLRPTAKNTVAHAEALGIKVKILTGDSREVAEYIGKEIGLVKAGGKVYIGDELEAMPAAEFKKAVLACDVFARVSPTQKFNIIKELKESYVVAYQGDGINDAPALKLADVAIAVNSATDIAKENADVVLLNKSLEVIINGIKDGRAIFININKYIKFTMISNFGNFIALSVLYLMSVNLPILAIQILLTTIITDLPAIAISTDNVEDSEVVRPEKHNVRELILIALLLGIPTAMFEFIYFLMVRSAVQPFLQTKLYVFFTLLGLVPLYIIRSKDHFWKAKRPSRALNISFILVAVISVALIYIPIFKNWFSFASLPAITIAAILALVVLYFLITDYVKVWYYRTLGKGI